MSTLLDRLSIEDYKPEYVVLQELQVLLKEAFNNNETIVSIAEIIPATGRQLLEKNGFSVKRQGNNTIIKDENAKKTS